jgi:hypothetical protein
VRLFSRPARAKLDSASSNVWIHSIRGLGGAAGGFPGETPNTPRIHPEEFRTDAAEVLWPGGRRLRVRSVDLYS